MLGASAGELYCADEVELLLEEIRELEPTSCRGEDVQDFEIAGSGAGAGRSPGSPPSPHTEHSWDSHAHYTRAPPPRPRAVAPLYCRLGHLLSPEGAVTLLLVLCCAAACSCAWAAAGLRAPAAARPLLLGALSSLLLHALLLLLHVSRLAALLPLPWPRVSGCLCAWSAAWLAGGAAAVLAAPAHALAHAHAHRDARALFYAAAGSALGGALAAALGVGAALRAGCARRGRRPEGARAAYRAVPAHAPPTPPAPSTSRLL